MHNLYISFEWPSKGIDSRAIKISARIRVKREIKKGGRGVPPGGYGPEARARAFPVAVRLASALDLCSVSLPAPTSVHCAPMEVNSLQNQRGSMRQRENATGSSGLKGTAIVEPL